MQMGASFMTLGSPQEVFHAETLEGNLCSFPPFYVGSRELGRGVAHKRSQARTGWDRPTTWLTLDKL